MRLPTPQAMPPTVPVAALADAAMLLVLFFVLTTTYDVDRTPIALPAAAGGDRAELDAACVVVARELTPTGREVLEYRFSDGRDAAVRLRGIEGLYLEASRVADRAPGRTFVVRADAEVRFTAVDSVLESLRAAGVRRVLLETRPSDAGAGSTP